jgi:hypothetical protein
MSIDAVDVHIRPLIARLKVRLQVLEWKGLMLEHPHSGALMPRSQNLGRSLALHSIS